MSKTTVVLPRPESAGAQPLPALVDLHMPVPPASRTLGIAPIALINVNGSVAPALQLEPPSVDVYMVVPADAYSVERTVGSTATTCVPAGVGERAVQLPAPSVVLYRRPLTAAYTVWESFGSTAMASTARAGN